MFITKHLFLPTLDGSRKRRSNEQLSNQSYTWHFSTQGLPAPPITWRRRELLPHVFTFSPPKRGSYFLWHCLLLLLTEAAGSSPVGRSVLSGLSSPVVRGDSAVGSSPFYIMLKLTKTLDGFSIEKYFCGSVAETRIVLVYKVFYLPLCFQDLVNFLFQLALAYAMNNDERRQVMCDG